MTLEEYKKKVTPGTRVFVMFKGEKLSGTAGEALDPKGETEPLIKFDGGAMSWVTDKNVAHIHIEVIN